MNNQFPFFQGGDSQGQFGNFQFPGSMMPPFGQFPGQSPNQFPGFPGTPGFPSSPGFPGQQPGQFPGGFPGQQGQQGAPTSPPPSFVPQQQSVGVFAVDPGAIRGCLFRNTYVWLTNGNAFWFFPTFVGRNSIAGFRWTGRRWTYYGTDLNRISSFQCF